MPKGNGDVEVACHIIPCCSCQEHGECRKAMETLFIYALGLDVLKLVRNTVNAERQWRQHGVQRWRMLNGLVRNTVNAERQWRPSCLIQSGGH